VDFLIAFPPPDRGLVALAGKPLELILLHIGARLGCESCHFCSRNYEPLYFVRQSGYANSGPSGYCARPLSIWSSCSCGHSSDWAGREAPRLEVVC